jgi:hypothetical protein
MLAPRGHESCWSKTFLALNMGQEGERNVSWSHVLERAVEFAFVFSHWEDSFCLQKKHSPQAIWNDAT